jgi:hypothetical protein
MMSRLRIAPIVEGHGEDGALRILLQRVASEIFGDAYVEVSRPIRGKRMKLVQSRELARALDLAMLKLRAAESDDPAMILVLLDADEDLPCQLGPDLLKLAQDHRADADIVCVVANVEYETWLVAGASSLGDYLDLTQDQDLPEEPEKRRLGKNWIQQRFRGSRSYSPTVDQPAMTSQLDLRLVRERSPSFDKLCRELEKRLTPPPARPDPPPSPAPAAARRRPSNQRP